MKSKEDELFELIAKWVDTNNIQRKIIKYLYEHTELFEQKYESDYYYELYSFFSGKITRCSRDHNKLMEILNEQQKRKLRITQLLMR